LIYFKLHGINNLRTILTLWVTTFLSVHFSIELEEVCIYLLILSKLLWASALFAYMVASE